MAVAPVRAAPSRAAPPRIVTLTLNPAVDFACMAPSVVPSHKIRTDDERYDPGGGGINVARVIHALGGDTLAMIMTGGVTGRFLEELLDAEGVRWRALPIAGRTRISVTVHDRQSGLEYRFVPEGPLVSETEWRGALAAMGDVDADWIVASGSLPRGVPADFYARLAAVATERCQRLALDTSGAPLAAAVGHGIDLLKMSLGEFEGLIGRAARDPASQEDAMARLLDGGAARMAVVSLGSEGALLATRGEIVRVPALQVSARGAAGAGDSFLAGLVLGLARGQTHRDALALGNAAGAAAVGSYGTALVTREAVETLLRQQS